MSALVLRLAAPLQSWGDSSRFVRRGTADAPSKSGVLGLIGAALGYRRTDSVEGLLGLRFGARLDRPGTVIRDFQTARTLDGRASMPLTNRHYLSDAAFLAVVEGDERLITSIRDALLRPTFPLYLGRRSCPPTLPLVLEVSQKPLFDVLKATPWIAPPGLKQGLTSSHVKCEVLVDAEAVPREVQPEGKSLVRDLPLSFDPERREYGWREVVRAWVDVPSGVISSNDSNVHDPMALLED